MVHGTLAYCVALHTVHLVQVRSDVSVGEVDSKLTAGMQAVADLHVGCPGRSWYPVPSTHGAQTTSLTAVAAATRRAPAGHVLMVAHARSDVGVASLTMNVVARSHSVTSAHVRGALAVGAVDSYWLAGSHTGWAVHTRLLVAVHATVSYWSAGPAHAAHVTHAPNGDRKWVPGEHPQTRSTAEPSGDSSTSAGAVHTVACWHWRSVLLVGATVSYRWCVWQVRPPPTSTQLVVGAQVEVGRHTRSAVSVCGESSYSAPDRQAQGGRRVVEVVVIVAVTVVVAEVRVAEVAVAVLTVLVVAVVPVAEMVVAVAVVWVLVTHASIASPTGASWHCTPAFVCTLPPPHRTAPSSQSPTAPQ
jgi:hypothetical protein